MQIPGVADKGQCACKSLHAGEWEETGIHALPPNYGKALPPIYGKAFTSPLW